MRLDRNYLSVRFDVTSKCNINWIYFHNLDFANKETDMSGNQDWYYDNIKKERDCGSITASNIIYYLAKKNSTKYGKTLCFIRYK